MKLVNLLGATASAALALSATSALAITYTGDHAVGTDGHVNISITTDGALGALGSGDITSFNILISDSTGSVDLTNLNSGLLILGSDLVATPTTLSFDFSSSLDDSGLALFELGGIGDSGPAYCLTNGGCYGESTPVEELNVQPYPGPFSQNPYSGPVVIATAGGVPEPATWALMLVGVAAGGAALRSSRRRAITA